jgi:hypothetical protein
MSLFHSQTIFNILITLIICSAMFLFFRAKMRILEISQREQAKVLQSLVISMRNGGGHSRQDMVSDDEIMKHVQMQMQMQQGGAGAGAGAGSGAGNQNRHTNDLIDVSDDDEDNDDDDDESESSSSSSSDSEDDETDSEEDEEENEENHENHENTTKKIIFNNSGALDIHSHTLEHLTGDDIKVIELSEPLYAVGGGNVSGTKDLNHHDTNDVTDDDGDDDENASDDDDDDDDDEETSDNTEVKIEELPNHASLSLHQAQHLETSVTDINTIEIKTIFKADKQQQQQPQQPQQQHADYNSMNVQTLKQHLKTKLSADGMHYNETAINKLNKKELIKHLTQG